jgi:hypothetical protein
MEDVSIVAFPFYEEQNLNCQRECITWGQALDATLKTLAYGSLPYFSRTTFQMSPLALEYCCRIIDCTSRGCMRRKSAEDPTPGDLKALLTLHKKQHWVDCMFASLDCIHTYWKNCPQQGSYQGKRGKPSIVLEAAADYHLWFWHASYYGYAEQWRWQTY